MKFRAPLKSKSPKIHTSPGVIIGLFLFISLSILCKLYYSKRSTQFLGRPLEDSYSTLRESVKQGGFAQFETNKTELKNHILKILQSPKNEEEEIHALNIAMYLFPEVLPDTHFEKQLALENWAPLEAAIEKQPRSAQARMFYEELKSNIWNFENPKINNAGLSIHARETLSIYQELSSP